MSSYRNILDAFLKLTLHIPSHIHITTTSEKKVLERAWLLHKPSCNKHSWKAHSSINVQTPAVLGLTLIHTLIKGNPFNQKIWLPGYSKCGPWSRASCNSATWRFVRKAAAQTHWDLRRRNLQFTESLEGLPCTVKEMKNAVLYGYKEARV